MRSVIAIAAGVLGAHAAVQALIARQETLRPRDLDPAGLYARVGGVELHYTRTGNGPPLVLLHGFASSTACWRRLAPQLSGHTRHALDLPGYGASERVQRPEYATDHQAELVGAWLDRLGLRQVDLLAHSFGGRVALQLALARPELVRRLALIAPEVYAASRPPAAALLRLPLLGPAVAYAALNPLTVGPGLRMVCRNRAAVDNAMVAAYMRPLRVRGTVAAQLAQARSPKDGPGGRVPQQIGRLQQPVLLIWGEGDPVFAADEGRRLARDLPNAQLALLPNTGHLPHEERPGEVAALLQNFFTLGH